MFIRYHIIYLAIASLLSVLSRYFHPLFYIVFGLYSFWILYRLGWKYMIIVILMTLPFQLITISIPTLSDTIEGSVIKTSEKYCYVKTDIGNVKLYHEHNLHYGDYIKAKIKILDMNENTNDHAFNERIYLYGQKVFYKASIETLSDRESHVSFYQWIEERLSCQSDVQDYQRLFLFGEKSENIQEDYQSLSQMSLVHLFALSGMHIHILYYLLQKGLAICVKQNAAKWIAYGCIGFYIFSIPMQISLYRAFFVLILYEILKKWLNQLDVLSLLVIVSLLYNPYYIYNISFIFSYFIYFIVLLTKDLKYSSFFIYLSGIPIVLSINYQIPVSAYILGSLLTPMIELIYSLCCLSLFFPVFLLPLELCITILQMIIQFLEMSQIFLGFSKPTLGFIIFFYLIYFTMIYKIELHQKIQRYICMMLGLFLAFSMYSQYKIYGEVTMIDVGQGDCTLIRLPMNQGNILVDTGGHKDFDLATKTIIPYLKSIGIHQLDYVYISHSDFDHCGALDSLVEHFDVEEIIDTYEEEREIGCMKVKMLKGKNVYSDNNDQSLVMLVELPAMTILFTGDASTEVEKNIYEQYHHINADVLKVSHHGSYTATSPKLLEMIQPQIAMIGVKKNNLYHHPSHEVIERLKRKQITILRTDEDGMFHIRFYGKSRYIFR